MTALALERPGALGRVADAYDDVFLVLAPPRTASTALARVFWGHEAVAFYAHEPFDRTFHEGAPLRAAADAMLRPLDLRRVLRAPWRRNGLVVKEMTFQVGDAAGDLIDLATRPVVFLLRDPRLTVWSRMRMLGGGSRPVPFPPSEMGWNELRDQVRHCRRRGIAYALLDASDMRRDPDSLIGRLFARLGLTYSPALRSWRAVDLEGLGALGDAQRHWYSRILRSSGIEPPAEPVPGLERFPDDYGLRAHVERALRLYQELRGDPCFIRPPLPRSEAA